MCGGGGRAPEDKSDKVARIEADAAAQQRQEERRQQEIARQREEEEEARELQEFQDRLSSAFSGGVGSAEQFFQRRGVDPGDYRSDILSEARTRRSQIPELSSDVGSYFSGLGEDVYTDLTDALRNQSLRGIREIAPEGFARRRLADTADDEILNAILGEQQSEAQDYAQNLLSRGVVTQSGLDAALEDIMDQSNRARFTLDELGGGILEGGRSEARDIANRGRSRASQLELGEEFDPYTDVGGGLEEFFSGFMSSLGDRLRANAPTDLFDVSGLPVIAGAAQGAGNTAFDPRAVAGILGEEDEDEDEDIIGAPF